MKTILFILLSFFLVGCPDDGRNGERGIDGRHGVDRLVGPTLKLEGIGAIKEPAIENEFDLGVWFITIIIPTADKENPFLSYPAWFLDSDPIFDKVIALANARETVHFTLTGGGQIVTIEKSTL